MAFVHYQPNPNKRWTGDCVIRALSIATGFGWERLYIELCLQGYMMGAWGDDNAVWGAYLTGRGFSVEAIPNRCPDCTTVRGFCETHPRGTYVLATGDHVVAAVDGDYMDAWDSGDEIVTHYYWRDD